MRTTRRARGVPGATAALALLVLAGCGGPEAPGAPEEADAARRDAYAEPPLPLAVVATPSGGILVRGRAEPHARIRAVAADGSAFGATADADGGFAVELPPVDRARLVAFSTEQGDRSVQAEGWLLSPPGAPERAVLLSPGAPARPLRADAGLLATVDYDGAGGAALSGFAEPGADVRVQVDGRDAARGRADARGLWSVRLPERVAPGARRLRVTAGALDQERTVRLESGAPASGPFAARREADAWRVDWITPGGGAQTTLVFVEG